MENTFLELQLAVFTKQVSMNTTSSQNASQEARHLRVSVVCDVCESGCLRRVQLVISLCVLRLCVGD